MPRNGKTNKQKHHPKQAGSINNYFLRRKQPETVPQVQEDSGAKFFSENKMADSDIATSNSGKTKEINDSEQSKSKENNNENIKENTEPNVTNSDLKNLMLEISETLSGRIDGLEKKLDSTKTSMENKIDNINTRINSVEKKCENIEKKLTLNDNRFDHIENHSIKKLNDNLAKIEAETQKAFDFDNDRIVAIEKSLANAKPESVEKLEERIKQLEETNQYQEWRSRRYNLLVYGIKEGNDEDTAGVFKKFLIDNCKIEGDRVEKIGIANCHRIPKNPDSDPDYKPGAPNAIIIKFLTMKDRNTVMASARNLPKGMAVRTDLPKALKTKRARLARQAYQIRKTEKKQTAIRESPFNVWLEVRKDRSAEWARV